MEDGFSSQPGWWGREKRDPAVLGFLYPAGDMPVIGSDMSTREARLLDRCGKG